MRPAAGENVLSGRYRLVEPLATGGMGTVWRAYDDVLDRPVAVKEVLLPPGLAAEEREVLRQRTMREARAAAKLRHSAIVTIYDVVEQDDRPWIVMELVPSQSLDERIRTRGPLLPSEAAAIGLRILDGLVTAQAAGVQHRDIKPANVLLADDGRVVLTDFGIARHVGDETLTSAGLLVGSPNFLAPERARGLQSAGLQSDLWSLGATLYTAVEGHPPFERNGPLPTLAAVVMDEPPPARRAGPLRPVIDGLLVKDPRYRLNADGARAMLQRALRPGAPDGQPADTVPAPRPAPHPTRPLPPTGPEAATVVVRRQGPTPAAATPPAAGAAGAAATAAGATSAGAAGTAGAAGAAGAAAAAAADRTGVDTAPAAPPAAGTANRAGTPADTDRATTVATGATPTDDDGGTGGPAATAPSGAPDRATPAAARPTATGGPPGPRGVTVDRAVPAGAAGAAGAAATAAAGRADTADDDRPTEVQPGDGVPTGTAPLGTAPAPPGRQQPDTRTTTGTGIRRPAVVVPERSRHPALLLIVAAVVLLAAVAVLLPQLLDDGRETAAPPATTASPGSTGPGASTPTDQGAAPVPGPAGRPSGSPSGSRPGGSPPGSPARTTTPGGAGVAALPAGFTRYTDRRLQFQVGIPAGWTAGPGRTSAQIRFDDPNSARYLLIETSFTPEPDPYDNWVEYERTFSATHSDYEKIAIRRVDYGSDKGWETADWEFRLGNTHVLDRNVLVNSSRAHAIYWSTPESMWNTADSRRIFDVAAASFVSGRLP